LTAAWAADLKMKVTSRQQSIFFKGVRRIFILAASGLIFNIIFMAQTGKSIAASATAFEESEVKSVFLFNLTKFIVWPAETEGGAQAEFSIAILGMDPFGRHLDKVIMSETVKGRKIRIRRYRNMEEVQWQEIDLLFIGNEMLDDLPYLSIAARDHGVLTVGGVTGFCRAGGMVNLLTVDNRIKIEVNIAETKRSDFLVSAQMLKLARIVKTGTEDDQ